MFVRPDSRPALPFSRVCTPPTLNVHIAVEFMTWTRAVWLTGYDCSMSSSERKKHQELPLHLQTSPGPRCVAASVAVAGYQVWYL